MSRYVPDRWVVIEIASEGTTIQRILSSWYGGYGGSDNWRLSSGITKVEESEDSYIFTNESGSIYTCYKRDHGMSFHTKSILEGFKKQASITMVEKYEPEVL